MPFRVCGLRDPHHFSIESQTQSATDLAGEDDGEVATQGHPVGRENPASPVRNIHQTGTGSASRIHFKGQ